MASYIKTLKDINDDVILPKTSSSAVIMADGTTSLENITSQFIRAVDSSAESPVLISASEVVLSDLSGNYTDNVLEGAMTEVANSISAIENTLANLSADAVDIIVTPAGNIESTNVQDALEELDTALGNINLTAGAISNTPAGNISSTNVQAAINELDTEKAPLSSPTFTGNTQINSLGVGTTASGTAGEIRATNNITAYYSDERLKDFHGTIPLALGKVLALNGYYFTENEKAKELGYSNDRMQVGVSAQQVQAVLPEAVTDAPIGGGYLTVWYEKIVPLLIEAIKEQQKQIDELKARL